MSWSVGSTAVGSASTSPTRWPPRSGSTSGSACPSPRSRGCRASSSRRPRPIRRCSQLMMSVMGPARTVSRRLTLNGAMMGFGADIAVQHACRPRHRDAGGERHHQRPQPRPHVRGHGQRRRRRPPDRRRDGEGGDGRAFERPRRLPRRRQPVRLRLHARRHAHPDARRRRRSGTPAPADPSATPTPTPRSATATS